MSKQLELVKRAYEGWEGKKLEILQEVLHTDYKGYVPGGYIIEGIEGAKNCIDSCPFEDHSENVSYIGEGDEIMRVWDYVVTAPTPFRMRMAELSVVKDGKIIKNEAFFDSAAFPKEAMDLCDPSKVEGVKQA